MVSRGNDGHGEARKSLLSRALVELMNEDEDLWQTVYDLENVQHPWLANCKHKISIHISIHISFIKLIIRSLYHFILVQPIHSCSCDS